MVVEDRPVSLNPSTASSLHRAIISISHQREGGWWRTHAPISKHPLSSQPPNIHVTLSTRVTLTVCVRKPWEWESRKNVEAVRRPRTRSRGDLATVAEMDVGFTLAIGSKNIASDSVRRWVTGMQQYEGQLSALSAR